MSVKIKHLGILTANITVGGFLVADLYFTDLIQNEHKLIKVPTAAAFI